YPRDRGRELVVEARSQHRRPGGRPGGGGQATAPPARGDLSAHHGGDLGSRRIHRETVRGGEWIGAVEDDRVVTRPDRSASDRLGAEARGERSRIELLDPEEDGALLADLMDVTAAFEPRREARRHPPHRPPG